jgi:Coenzyme PQQ synthesis protein D (PqqD)
MRKVKPLLPRQGLKPAGKPIRTLERIMQITRRNTDAVIENKLPDGSRLLVDSRNERVIALNAMAGAAWDACGAPTTVAGVAESMRRSLGPDVSDEIVEDAIAQLQDKDLITSAASLSTASRRAFMARLGAAAVPLVVAMTMREQRAYAGTTGSGTMGKGPGSDGPGDNWPGGSGPGHNSPGGSGPGGDKGCDGWLFDPGCGKNSNPWLHNLW